MTDSAGAGASGAEVPEIETFYPTLPSMLRRYDRRARQNRFPGRTPEEFARWKKDAVLQLRALLGIGIIEEENSCRSAEALKAERMETVRLKTGILREKWILYPEEDVCMPFYVLIPPDADASVRPFLCPPGHGGAGKSSVAGLRDDIRIRERIRQYNYDYGLQLAGMGYAAVCPDIRGLGERREVFSSWQDRELPDPFSSDCALLARMGEPLGVPVAGMLVWDLMKLSDWIQARGAAEKCWDPDSLSCLGFSGGGMQTLFLSALDERIKLAVISGYMYGYRDALLRQSWNCSCNYIPHLWEHFDMGDIASLIAPRPLLIQSCLEDRQNGPRGLKNVLPQVETIREAYLLNGAGRSLIHEICEGPHCWHGEDLGKHLRMLTE